MKTRSFCLIALFAAALVAIQARGIAQDRAPGIAIDGSGIIGTSVNIDMSGEPGHWFILYLGLLPAPTQSWTGQTIGLGQYYVPVNAGRFDASGQASFQFPIPDIDDLVGLGMAYFQFETFEAQVFPPSFEAKAVSPGAYFIVAPKGSGNPTKFAVDPTHTEIGSTLTLRMTAQPGDFVVGYWGLYAAPVVIPEVQTVIGVVPAALFTPLLARLDGNGEYVSTFPIPDVPTIIGINAYFQYQTFKLTGFPPTASLEDSSMCLFFTVQDKR